jgi:hypothetical protein
MPCNSIAIAQVKVSNLERLLLGKLADPETTSQLRDALCQAIIAELGAQGVDAWRMGADLATGLATIHLGREGAAVRSSRQKVRKALNAQVGTALTKVAAQLIGEMVKADLLADGFEITHDISHPNGVRSFAWNKPVGHRIVTGEVLIAPDGAMALRTTAGTFEVGSDLLTMIREMMKAQGIEWTGEWQPEQHRPDDPGDWVEAHEHPPWAQMQAEAHQHLRRGPIKVVRRG